MACTYSVNGKESLTLERLALEYYKSKTPLKESYIFSTAEEDSSMSILLEQVAKKNEIIELNRATVTDVIVREQADVLQAMGLSATRLAPQYDVDNRIYQTVVKNLVANGHIEEELLKLTLDQIKADPALSEAIEYEKDVRETIEAEEKTNNLIMAIQSAIDYIITDRQGSDPYRRADRILESAAKKAVEDQLIKPEEEALLINQMHQIVDKINRIIFNGKTPIAEVFLTTKGNATIPMTGEIDIVAISSEGIPHIYTIKSSKRDFQNWDSAKKLYTDYQLAFQRALLGQYIDVSRSSLTVLPIQTGLLVNGKLNPNLFTFGSETDRSGDPEAGLMFGDGRLFKIANRFIPDYVHIRTDEERANRILGAITDLMPNYSVKTTYRKYDREKLIQSILSKAYFSVNTEDMSQFKKSSYPLDSEIFDAGTDRFTVKDIMKYSEEERQSLAEQAADTFLDFLTNKETRNVTQLKAAIVAALNAGDASKLGIENEDQKRQVIHALQPYLNHQYSLIESVPELDSLGVIILKNSQTGQLVPISISARNFLGKYNEKYSYLDTEYFKVFTILNEMYDELRLRMNKLQDIVILDFDQGVNKSKDIRSVFLEYKKLAANKLYHLNLNEENDLPTFGETTMRAINGILRTYDGEEKEKIYNIFQIIQGNIEDASVEQLRVVERQMAKHFGYENKTFKSTADFRRPSDYIYALVKSLLLTRYGIAPEGDVTGLRDYALKYHDFFGVLKAFYSEDITEYNKAQEKVLGVVGGLKTITPDKIASKDLFEINKIITGSVSLMRHEIAHLGAQVRSDTSEYYADIHYTSAEQQIVGNARKHFKPLWLHEGDEVSNQWRVKNPYSFESENVMTPDQRKYLKKILFKIQRQLLKIPNDVAEAIDPTSLETIQSSAPKRWADLIMMNIDNGNYFRMPLIWTNTLSQYEGLFKGKQGVKQAVKGVFADVQDFVDRRELDEEDRNKAEQTAKGYFEMYEIYGKQSSKFIAQKIEERGVGNFELDLDTIAFRVIQEKVRKKYVDTILPVLNDYAWWVQLTGAKQNAEVTKALKYIQERIDLAFYDKPIINSEYSDIITAAGVVKKITTANMLAFRPVLLVKELAIGLYKGVALAATQFFGKDQFTLKDYTEAMGKMLVIDKQLSLEFNKIEALNHFYSFANMDLNTYSRKIQSNRRGLFMGLSPYMYACNTVPDYYNRMVLFIAKMIHDGSYDAHYVTESGEIKYDPTKDKRFSHYFSVREQYRLNGGKYIFGPSQTDEKYNTQKQLYDVIRNEINVHRKIAKLPEFKEEDLIDQAYSEQERSSYKSFTDTVYGYYDKEQSPTWHYTVFGILYLQFMQFWPGKMSMWFGHPVKDRMKIAGVHRQATTINAEGKKVKLWRKPVINEQTGEIIEFKHVEENTGDPLIIWTGLPHEGIIFSMAKTIRDVAKGLGDHKSFSEIKQEIDTDDELRLNRVKYGLADGVLMYLFFCLFKILIEAAFGDNPEGMTAEAKEFSVAVNKKMINEAMLWDNTFGNLRSEPAFWTYSLKAIGDVADVFNGNKTIQNLIATNIKAFEFMETEE